MTQSPLMLSISGLRGIVGRSLTPPLAARYAAAFGAWLKRTAAHPSPTVVLGRDSRPSGPAIEHAAVAALLASGCHVINLGIVATPTVGVMIDHHRAQGGIVLTASHNPIEWNGIKLLRHDGVAPPPDQAAQIIQRFHDDDFDYVEPHQTGHLTLDPGANDIHVKRVTDHLDVAAIRKRKPRIVLDSVHGAGGPGAALLAEQLGVDLVHLFAEPTGIFPHTPEPTAENLTGLCDAVKTHHAEVGFAQDPDADRLALVDDRGQYIGEEYTLALCTLHLMSRPDAAASPAAAGAVANLSTSRMIDDVAAKFSRPVHRTPVGEANVANAMRNTAALIGGEGNGGVIWPPVGYVRDSLAGIALILEMIATTGKSLSQLVDAIPAYTIIKDKLPIQDGMADRAIASLSTRFADQRVDLQDGIRIDLPEGWVHVRPSNTEPILRIIAEAADAPTAQRLVDDVRKRVEAAG